jgi:hypothetical protein
MTSFAGGMESFPNFDRRLREEKISKIVSEFVSHMFFPWFACRRESSQKETGYQQ